MIEAARTASSGHCTSTAGPALVASVTDEAQRLGLNAARNSVGDGAEANLCRNHGATGAVNDAK